MVVVVSNFPVKEVKKMGADFVIGSRVAMGLQPVEKLDNPIKILMQIAFFKEAVSSKDDIKLCDIYIPDAAGRLYRSKFFESR